MVFITTENVPVDRTRPLLACNKAAHTYTHSTAMTVSVAANSIVCLAIIWWMLYNHIQRPLLLSHQISHFHGYAKVTKIFQLRIWYVTPVRYTNINCTESSYYSQNVSLTYKIWDNQYMYSISQEICTRFFALLCFVVVIHWLIFPYPSGLLHWHCGNDCPSASKATLMNMDKYFMWLHYERLYNHNKAKHNKTMCIFLGIYCRSLGSTRNIFQNVFSTTENIWTDYHYDDQTIMSILLIEFCVFIQFIRNNAYVLSMFLQNQASKLQIWGPSSTVFAAVAPETCKWA